MVECSGEEGPAVYQLYMGPHFCSQFLPPQSNSAGPLVEPTTDTHIPAALGDSQGSGDQILAGVRKQPQFTLCVTEACCQFA